MRLSIIIPTWNEEKTLLRTLRTTAAACPDAEILVVDGASSDGTREVFQRFADTARQRAQWLVSERGRGRQMNTGAGAATGDVLLFLHADTLLPPDAETRVREALADPRILGGNFRIAFEPRSRLSDFYAFCYNLRSHLKVFYGDSALFVRKAIFERLKGYRADRIMEDVEFIGRLRRTGKLAYLTDATVITSSRRFHGTRKGLRMLFIWTLLHTLMAAGVSQETLERFYPPSR